MAGQILKDEFPAKRSTSRRGDHDLAEAKKKIFLESLKGAALIGSAAASFSSRISSDLTEDLLVDSGTRLSAKASSQIYRNAAKEFKSFVETIDGSIRSRIEKSMVRTLSIQNSLLKKQGREVIKLEQFRDIRETALKLLEEEFPPGSGLTYSMRLERIYRNHSAQIKMILNRTHSNKAISTIIRDLQNGLAHTGATRTPIIGGSASKKLQRLLVAEESRLAGMVEREILKVSGISFGYWRLSPLHQWYGGQEICEVLASKENTRAAALLVSTGKRLGAASSEGLYALDQWPSYPHPYCRCYLEPVF